MPIAHRATAIAAIAALAPLAAAAQRDRFDGVREAARAEIAAGTMPGIAVSIVHQGRVVFAEGFGRASMESSGAVTPDTVFQVGSAGKMLTAAAVLETAADGRIEMHAPIAQRVTGLDTAIGSATLHHLLAQTSGLRDMTGAHGEQGDDAHGRFLRALTARDRLLPAGAAFSYSNIGYSLAGFAAAEASASDFGRLMARRVFGPAGMVRSSVRPNEAMTWPLSMGHLRQKDGTFTVVRPMAHDTRLWPAGYVFTTASDLARFTMAMLDEGRIDGRPVLRSATVREMLRPHVDLPWTFEGWRYGYGLFLMPMRGLEVAEHAGSMVGFAALVRLVPAHGFAVIALSNSETPAARTADAAMDAVLPVTAARPRPPDGPALEIDTAALKAYAGRYENRGHFTLSFEEGLPVLRQNDGPPLSVVRVGADRYVASAPEGRPRLRFVLRPPQNDTPPTLLFSLWAFPGAPRAGQ